MRLCLAIVSGAANYEVSPTQMPKHTLKTIIGHASVDEGKTIRLQTHTENYWKLNNAKSRRNNFPQG